MAPICVLNTPTDEVLTHSCKEDLQSCPQGVSTQSTNREQLSMYP